MPSRATVPADVLARADQALARRRGPALLALVVLGRISTRQAAAVRCPTSSTSSTTTPNRTRSPAEPTCRR